MDLNKNLNKPILPPTKILQINDILLIIIFVVIILLIIIFPLLKLQPISLFIIIHLKLPSLISTFYFITNYRLHKNL
jgi:hypothetical protein